MGVAVASRGAVDVPARVTYESHGPASAAGWRFSAWQVPVYNSAARKKVICAGRGAGKDVVCLRAGLRDAIRLYARRRNEKGPELRNPVVCVWLIAEQEKNLKQLRRDMRGELQLLAEKAGVPHRRLFRYVAREDAFEIFGANQIRVECVLSKHKDSLRGPGVDVYVWTEFAMVKRVEAWTEELPGTINRAGRAGIGYINSTPKGPTGLFRDEADEAAECGAYWHATAFDNEFLSEDQLAAIRAEERRDPEVFRQERLAEWVVLGKGASRFFDAGAVRRCLTEGGSEVRSQKSEVVVGVDIARLGADSSWFVPVEFESGLVLDMTRKQKTRGPELVKLFETVHAQHGGPEFVMDATQHQAFVADFVPRHIRITEMKIYERARERLCLNLRHLIEIGRVKIPDPESYPFRDKEQREAAVELVRQLLCFQKLEQASGLVKYQAPADDHDDAVYALALACDPIARAMGGIPDADRAIGKFAEVMFG